MAQQYSDPTAIKRMRDGNCPECGYATISHTGAGGPAGCSLTDNGVAQRIEAQRVADTEAGA